MVFVIRGACVWLLGSDIQVIINCRRSMRGREQDRADYGLSQTETLSQNRDTSHAPLVAWLMAS